MEAIEKVICIRVDAGHKKGMGHLFRMCELADEFKKKDFRTRFIVRNDASAVKILVEKGFAFDVIRQPIGEEEIIQRFTKEYTIDLWIYDMLDTKSCWIELLKRKGVKVVCIDDKKGGLECADLVINPIVGLWDDKHRVITKTRIYNGIDYAMMPTKIKNYRKKRSTEEIDGALRLSVSMGGSDTYGSTVKIADALGICSEFIDTVSFYLGPAFGHLDELVVALTNYKLDYQIKYFVPNLLAELDGSDVVVCSGGATLFEVCAMGLPALSFANEKFEEKTIAYFDSMNACVNVGSIYTTETELLGNNISQALSDRSLLNGLSKSALDLVDGKGTIRTTKMIIEYCL